MRCKHRRVIMYRRVGDAWEHTMTLSGVTLMWQRFFEVDRAHCGDCGHQMALAESNDDDERVAIEIAAAARIAFYRDQSYRPGADRFYYCPETKITNLSALCESLYLAHEAATHGDDE